MHSLPLLLPAEVVVLLIEPQPGLAFALEPQSRSTLEKSLVAVANAANAFEVPIVLPLAPPQPALSPPYPA